MPVNMLDATVDYTSPEYTIVSTGAADMAEMYGLPSMVSSFGTTGEEPGIDGSLCEIFSCAGTTPLRKRSGRGAWFDSRRKRGVPSSSW